MALASLPACAKTVHVPADYSTITSAVSQSVKGDTIIVSSGTYIENVIIDKAVTIIGHDTGSGMPVLDGQGKDGFTITSGSVTLQGFKVIDSDSGIRVNPSIQNSFSKISLIGNTLTGNSYGINGHGYINVVDNNVSYNKNDGVYVMDTESNVTGNTVNGNGGRGLFLDSSEIYVAGNTVNNNANDGIFVQSDNNVVTGNVACNDYVGIDILQGNNSTVTDNMVSYNNWCGIWVSTDSCGNVITGNTADNNRYLGICLDYYKAKNNTVTGNSVYNNSFGSIAVYDSSSKDIVQYDTPEETFRHLLSFDFSANIVGNNTDNRPGPVIVPTSRAASVPSASASQAPASATQASGEILPGISAAFAMILAGIVMISVRRSGRKDR